jgi:hypothetical protein
MNIDTIRTDRLLTCPCCGKTMRFSRTVPKVGDLRNADIRVQIVPPCGYGRTSVRHYRNAVAVGFPTAKPPKALATGTFAQHATTMFFPHFVGDACSRKAAAR